MMNPSTKTPPNIVNNHDFSYGLQSWHPNCCSALVLTMPTQSESESESGGETQSQNMNVAVVTNRSKWWQGLQQDITARISPGSTYSVSARVGISGPLSFSGVAEVRATLKLEEYYGFTTLCNYIAIGKTSVSKGKWEMVEGTFTLSTLPGKLVFYLEGPPPGIDLLIHSVVISFSDSSKSDSEIIASQGCEIAGDDEIENIVLNPQFEDGLSNWLARCCKVDLHDSMGNGQIVPHSGKAFASATERTNCWNGIQQDISERVQPKVAYNVAAVIRIYGKNVTNATVKATLWVQTLDGRELYIEIANVVATSDDWVQLEGNFLLNFLTSRVVINVEGPPAGTDILLNALVVKNADKIPPSSPTRVIEEFHSEDELRIGNGVTHSRPTWEKPPKGYVKINFDGVLKEGAKFGGVGVMIRGENGKLLGAATIPFPGVSHLETIEAMAAIEASEFGLRMGFKNVILEGHAVGIVTQLNSSSSIGNQQQLIEDARSLIANFQKVKIMHVKRQGNQLAHFLATHALGADGEMSWPKDGDDFIKNVMESDVCICTN